MPLHSAKSPFRLGTIGFSRERVVQGCNRIRMLVRAPARSLHMDLNFLIHRRLVETACTPGSFSAGIFSSKAPFTTSSLTCWMYCLCGERKSGRMMCVLSQWTHFTLGTKITWTPSSSRTLRWYHPWKWQICSQTGHIGVISLKKVKECALYSLTEPPRNTTIIVSFGGQKPLSV